MREADQGVNMARMVGVWYEFPETLPWRLRPGREKMVRKILRDHPKLEDVTEAASIIAVDTIEDPALKDLERITEQLIRIADPMVYVDGYDDWVSQVD